MLRTKITSFESLRMNGLANPLMVRFSNQALTRRGFSAS
jgi:hypothetical protein